MTASPIPDFCAIDFGTSNSAIAVPDARGAMRLVPLEDGAVTMPTATFYLAEGPGLQDLPRLHGRAALAAYVEGSEGRLMRSMKSALGTGLMTQQTDIGAGRAIGFAEVISGYLRHLRRAAELHTGVAPRRAVIGRPVHFVDEDAQRDAQAQAALEQAAREAGFEEVAFQFEPLAAAFDHESRIEVEQRVLIADIGGGTSDFSIVRVGPQRRDRIDRADDVLAHHGLHVAGTDFDRRVELAAVMPALGFGALGPSIGGQPPREVPSRVYFDLATWHLINTVYRPARLQELLWANPRVVFFREEPLAGLDAQFGPRGAQGVALTPGRSIAVDPQSIPYGTPVWLASQGPVANLQRLVMAQDTGSAIVGAVRADYFAGWGAEAGEFAGRMKQPLRMWVLWPR